ncbi:hypothetical protein PROFUN_10709 [Planoprotostelium fungivorum]|uniref:Uncharacterized protein n=1 Tax=Planoprotostelium fungivorum TaxID=1890364 RepID=A0A2P6N9L9_9EUKA|nr:hypothetical protein PROFUN_10709 [Planoprotostelium fungivorum]
MFERRSNASCSISTNLPATINTNVTMSFLSFTNLSLRTIGCLAYINGTTWVCQNAEALPGLGTAIPRTPQPRQTLACLHRRDPRKGCSTPARFDHFRDFIICAVDATTHGLLPEGNTSRASSIGCRSDS